jgi:50S ribosomal protein L16 3-hydroxylase
MVHFEEVSLTEFLTEYWQKKPLVIRQALPDFVNPLTPDELAGLSMEEEIESRIVIETANKAPYWHLKRGPFLEKDFANLPETHWTLLVQGLDRFIPEITSMLDHFNFIPQWRVDDVMISYATEQGSVGPHYDNYDVFLYQAIGRRKWSLTTKDCDETNYLTDVELRIMRQFQVEEEYILEEGDMLYLPPHVGHYGKAMSTECMTYSFGYRSYQGQEVWDSFAEYLSEQKPATLLYEDPNWSSSPATSEVPRQAWLNAKKLMLKLLDDETQLQTWFGCFVTQLDQQAEALLPMPMDDEIDNIADFMTELADSAGLRRNAVCRFAYQESREAIVLFINGCEWDVKEVSIELVKLVANCRLLTKEMLAPFLANKKNQSFIFELWRLLWLDFD